MIFDQTLRYIDTGLTVLEPWQIPAVGFGDPRERKRPIALHSTAYLADLDRRGRDAKYRNTIRLRLNKAISACRWRTLGDCTTESLRRYLSQLVDQGLAAKTVNDHRADLNAFFAWLVRNHRLEVNPCNSVEGIADKREKTRRALSVAECKALLEAAPPKRSLVYLFLLYTGLRRSEARSITWGHLHLDGLNPRVELTPSITKSGQAESVPLVPALAQALREARGETDAGQRVFYAIPEMATFRRDLKKAGIPETDERGRSVVLHSLRHSLATMLADSGIPIALAQRLMRHRDIRLTAETYTDEGLLPLSAAVRELPELIERPSEPEAVATTGTDGRGVPHFVPPERHNRALSGTSRRRRQSRRTTVSHDVAQTCIPWHEQEEVPCVGLEPTTR